MNGNDMAFKCDARRTSQAEAVELLLVCIVRTVGVMVPTSVSLSQVLF